MEKLLKKVLALRSDSDEGTCPELAEGFTLIELLIVIALLGALAIGLIGAIDPFEQLKKGTDTGTRNTVSEVHASFIRYYALKGYMPWCTTSAEEDCDNPAGENLTEEPLATAITNVVIAGELKTNFTTVQSGELGKVTVTGDAQAAIVCYMPSSKSFQSDKNTEYIDIAGTKDTENTCKTNGGEANCYWCVQ